MKILAVGFSRNGRQDLVGILKAADDDGELLGLQYRGNYSDLSVKERFIKSIVDELGVNPDQARAAVTQALRDVDKVLSGQEPAGDGDDDKLSQATTLVNLAKDAELWHTPDGGAFATIVIDAHRETWGIRAKAFRDWLAYQFFQLEGKSPGGQATADALAVLSGQALFNGPEYSVFVRVAEVGGSIYLDLANDGWEVVRVTTEGWCINSDPPVRFRRARGMLALPHPVPGGDLKLLRNLLNLATDDDWALYLGCLVQALRGRGPYPVLVFYGEHGSAKSTASVVFRRVVDPNKSNLRSPPRDERDLRIQATNGWVIGHDNLSSIPDWLSNALCRISTGGGMGTRELFSDDEEVIFEGQRPIILNGIEEISSRPDLVDRSVILLLKTISEKARRTEREFWAAFDAAHPSILGGLLDAVVAGLRAEPDTHIDSLPRMADFALWAVAAESGLGLKPGAFLDAYSRNRASANDSATEGATIGPYVLQFVEASKGAWSGSATELLAALDNLAPESVRKQRSWPTRPNILGGKLRGIAPQSPRRWY